METFKGSIYIGTLNSLNESGVSGMIFGVPFKTYGAQIYQGNISTITNNDTVWQWSKVLSNGNGNINNFGVRKLYAYGDYLFGVTANYINGFELWRSKDGYNWDIIIKNGYNNDTNNLSGRSLIVFNGYLYVGIENRRTGAKLIARKIDIKNGSFVDNNWIEITMNGFNHRFNNWFSDFAIYNDNLYVGTLNYAGMQLYKSYDGMTFDTVFMHGNYDYNYNYSHSYSYSYSYKTRSTSNTNINIDININVTDALNWAIMKLNVFENKLYIGTMNLFNGASLLVNANDNCTMFDTIFLDGNNDRLNVYVWSMENYYNRLYIGTFKQFLLNETFESQFAMFSNDKPGIDKWVYETNNAFNNSDQYGLRTMKVFNQMGNEYLIMGTANAWNGFIVFQGIYNNSTN